MRRSDCGFSRDGLPGEHPLPNGLHVMHPDQGGTTVHGSIFIDCVLCSNVRVSGTADLAYDGDAVDAVIDDVWPGPDPPPLRLIAWQECPPAGCSF